MDQVTARTTSPGRRRSIASSEPSCTLDLRKRSRIGRQERYEENADKWAVDSGQWAERTVFLVDHVPTVVCQSPRAHAFLAAHCPLLTAHYRARSASGRQDGGYC